jgi:hypothetical protein
LAVTGADAGNYNIAITNADLTIARAALRLVASDNSKTYDGSTSSDGRVSFTGMKGDDEISGLSQEFSSKNVLGEGNSALQVKAIYTINDGNNGSNYETTLVKGNGTISRLSAVAWVGGSSTEWFDAANWQNGATPDLSNVANVTIPVGANVNFNNALAAPSQAGLVHLDNLSSLGSLTLVNGALNIENNFNSASLLQRGGTLGGAGNINVNIFQQTGGKLSSQGSFSVDSDFSQSDIGSIAVGGNVSITHATGDLKLMHLKGNNINVITANGATELGEVIAAGNLGIRSTGNISQTSSSTIKSGSASTLISLTGDVNLPNIGNDQEGVITASGVNINLADGSDPTIVLNATGNAVIVAVGNVRVSGSSQTLSVTSLRGVISNASALLTPGITPDSSSSEGKSDYKTVGSSLFGQVLALSRKKQFDEYEKNNDGDESMAKVYYVNDADAVFSQK